MKVIIEAENSVGLWHWGGDVLYVDIYALQPFETLDGQFILSGKLALRDAYLRVTGEVQAGNVPYIPSFEIDSTLDSPTNPAARYGAVIRDYRNVIRVVGWPGNLSSWSLTNVASQRWEDVITRNSGQSLSNPAPTYLNQQQTQVLIDSALGARNFSSETVVGVTALSEDPSDPNFPIAVSTTDPLWLALIGGGTGNEKFLSSYTDLADAIADIGSDVVTLVVDAQPVLTADTTVPANITTRWLGLYAISTGGTWTLTLNGPIVNDGLPIVDVVSDGTTTLELTDNEWVSPQVEWWGAKANWGGNRTEAEITDSTLAIQAAIDECIRPITDFAVSGITTQNNPLTEMGPYGRKLVCAGSGSAYMITDTLVIHSVREFWFEGNHSTFIWRGNDPDIAMWRIADVYNLNFTNLRITSNNIKPLWAGIQMYNDGATSVVTSTYHHYRDVIIEGRDSIQSPGGLQFGWIMHGFTGAIDANNEQFEFDHCAVFDYTQAGWSINGGQCRHHLFLKCQANGGGHDRGKRGVSLYTPGVGSGGSFTWMGGTVTSNYVADFQFNTATDNINIIGADSESSDRFIVTAFNEVNKGGLVGSVPAPPSLTMTTPAGSAWIGGSIPNLVTAGPDTHTFTANRDTYVLLSDLGAFQYIEFPNGADYWTTVQVALPGISARLAKVVTNGTEITSVVPMGGTAINDSTQGGSMFVAGCRFASAGRLATDQAAVIYGSSGTITFQNNTFNNGSNPVALLLFRGSGTPLSNPPITLIGNVWRARYEPSPLTAPEFNTLIRPFVGSLPAAGLNYFARSNGYIASNLGTFVPFLNQSSEVVSVANLRGISGGATWSNNLNGQVTISGSDTTATVTLLNTEPDANYDILLGLLKDTGAPTISLASVENQTTTTFDIRLASAPGLGTTVKVKWWLSRSQ